MSLAAFAEGIRSLRLADIPPENRREALRDRIGEMIAEEATSGMVRHIATQARIMKAAARRQS